jgi:hypothetical protein
VNRGDDAGTLHLVRPGDEIQSRFKLVVVRSDSIHRVSDLALALGGGTFQQQAHMYTGSRNSSMPHD